MRRKVSCSAHRSLYSIALLVALAAGAPALAQPAPKKPSPIGSWTIRGLDTEKTTWTGTLILTTGDKGELVATIDWTAKGGKYDGASGRELRFGALEKAKVYYTIQVEKDGKTRSLKVKPDGSVIKEFDFPSKKSPFHGGTRSLQFRHLCHASNLIPIAAYLIDGVIFGA